MRTPGIAGQPLGSVRRGLPLRAGAEGGLELLGPGELDAQPADLLGGVPLVGAHPCQQRLALFRGSGPGPSSRSVASSRSRIWSRVKPSGFIRRMTMSRATSVSV